ncbi:2TM domain-containing protein [Pseudozobellia thermophila]|uniref:2TM domain-containing protein n=2 Tax=Pseudozobellia thermophila TaxID=192903 RepID=A0A1M6FL73_9FLAO|nr:2TM domain-containing protein [Pseudozobellia thermophila]
MVTEQNDKKARAKKRVEELKGFYIHSAVYVVVNLFIMVVSVVVRMNEGESFAEAFFNLGILVTPFFWGLGLAFHALKVFSLSPIFGKEWEERQIRKFMEEDRREAEKYRDQ